MTSIRNRKHGNSVRAAGAVKRFGLVSTTALVPVMTALASAAMLLTPTAAHAQNGGDGGNNPGSGGIRSLLGPGSNGIGTPLSGGGGGAGATGGTGGGGGGSGGASAGTNGNGGVAAGSGGGGGAHGTLSATLPAIATIGGSGGAGAPAASGVNRGGGGGGAGGFGAVVTGGGNLGILTVNLSGGTGGAGGGGANGSYGGDGGSGGNGLVLTGNGTTVSIDSAVTGGNGGSGGSVGTAGGGTAGRGGTGGVGLQILGVNSVVTIGASGSVVGGNGGAALGGAGQGGGDAGITGGNLSLIVGGLVRGGTGIFGRADAVTFTGGTNVLEVLAGATFIGNVSANSGADTLRLGGAGNGTFDVSNIGSGRQFRNFGVFEKNGTSVWTLTGTSTAATPWAINGGTLSIATDGSLGAAGSMRFNGGALATTASFGTTRNVTLNAGGGTFAPAAGTTLTWSGNIAGSGALTKADTGTLTLSGNSSYAGLTTISAGTLVAASNNALGSSAGGTLVQDGATLVINGGVSNAEAITINGTGVGGLGALRVRPLSDSLRQVSVGTITLGSDASIDLGGDGFSSPLIMSEIAGNNHALTVSGVGALNGPINAISSFTATRGAITLNGTDIQSEVFVASGAILRVTGFAIGDLQRVNVASGAVFGETGGSETVGSIDGAGRIEIVASSGLTTGGDNTSSSIGSFLGSSDSSLTKTGTGTFTVAGGYDTFGSTNVLAGTLQIGNGGSGGNVRLGGVDFGGGNVINGTLAFNRSDNIAVSNIDGPILGTGNIIQRGTGTLTLGGNNTYSGLTTVERGTLVAASNNALGSSAGGTVVQDGATLVLNGGVTNAEAITINGTGVGGLGALRVGTGIPVSVGSITLGSDATINLGAELRFASLLGGGHDLTAIGDGTLRGPISNISSFIADGPQVRLYQANVAAPVFVKSGVLTVGAGSVADQTRINLAAGTKLFAFGGGTIGSVNGPGALDQFQYTTLTVGGDDTSFAVNSFDGGQGSSLRKIGAGTFTIAGAFETVGSIGVYGGTLQIGDGVTAGQPFLLHPIGGSGDTNGIIVNGTLAFNRPDNIGIDASSQPITGTGNLIQRGTGTLTLSGANTYAGLTTVERGTLVAASNGALGSSAGGTLVQDGATLVVNGGVFNSEAITINGSGVGGLGALRFAGTNIGVGTITLGSDARIGFDVRGDINLAGVVGNGHDLTIGSASVLNLGGGQMTGLGSLTYEAGAHALINATVDGPVFLQSGVTLQTSGLGGVTFGRVNVAAGSQLGAVAATNAGSIDGLGHVNVTGPLTVGRDNSSTTIGSITVNDYTTLTKVGTGTLTVAGSYQATNSNTVIEAGTLQIGDGGATGTILFGDPSIGPAPIIVNGTLAFNRSDDISLGGYVAPISGTGNLIQRGTGTLTLTGGNTYSGGTIVEAGTLSTGGGAALGSGAVTVLDGATLRLTGGTFANPMILNGAGAGGNGALQLVSAGFGTFQLGAISLGSDATIGFGASDPTVQTATLNGGGHALTVTGFGGLQGFATNLSALNVNGSQLRLFNTNIDAPIFVNSGTLLTNGNGIGDFSRVNLSAGTTLTVGNDETIGSVDGPGRILLSGNRTLTVGGDNSSSAIMTFDSNENSTLRKTGTGTFTILGGYDQMGGLQIDQGTLQIGNGGAIGPIFLGLSGQNVVNGTLAINRSDTITMGTDNPAFTGSGTIAQRGSGTLALGGNSVGFTGTVSVEAGTLSLGGTFGDQAGNSARLVVSDGGTLAGTGTFLGNATIATGGTLRPGNSPGTITFSSLTLDAGSHSVFELSQAGVVGGARNDLVRVTGNLALNGGNITIARGAGFSTGQYTLFQYGSLTGTLRNLTLDPLGGGFGGNLALGTGAVLLNVAGAADQVYWNGNTTNPAGSIVGGSGTWNLLDGNFSNASGTVSGAWAGNNALAIFGGASGGTVTIAPDTFLSPSGLNFRTDGYVIAGANPGSGLLLNGATGIDTATGVGATISAPISGSGSVTKTGAGTLTLAGTNSYSGSTTILGGTLVNTGTVAGDVANYATLISSGTVQGGLTNNSGAIANLSGTLNGTVSNAGTITAIGNLVSNGTFDNMATGRAAVNTGATWSGLSQVTNAGTADNAFAINGTLSVGGQFFNTAGARLTIGTGGSLLTAPATGSAGLLNETGALVVNAGTIDSSIDNSGFFTSTGTLTGQLVNNQGANATLSGAVGVIRNLGALTVNGNLVGTGTIDNSGTGTLTVNAGATWTGTTAISNNSTAANGFIVNGTLGTTGSFTNAAGASLTIATAGTLNVGGSINNAATARITNAGNIAGPVSNNGSLISTGAINGDLTNAAGATSALQGSLGGSVNNSGTVTLTGATAGITTVTQTSTGAFDLAGFDTTIGGLAGSGSVTLGTGTLTLGGDGRSTSFDGTISGAGGLLKNGAGTLTLSGVNTFTGETRIDAGGLTLAAGGVIAGRVRNGAAFVNSGTVSGLVVSTGDLLSSGIVQGGLTQSGGTARVSGTLNGTIKSAGTLTVEGILTSNGPVQTSGAGLTQILSGARWSGLTAFTNASANATGLRIAGSLNVSGIVTTQAGATTVIADGSGTLTASAIANFGTLTSAGTVNGDTTNAGTITNTGTWNGNLSQATGSTTNAARWDGAFRIDVGGSVTNTGNWTNATGFRSMVGAGLFENFGTLSGGGVTASGTTAVLANRTGGTITLASGSVLAADTGGTITNAGSIVGDVQVLAGGNVSNLAGGTWRGSATVTTGGRFTNAGTVNGDVTNTGTITNTGIWNGNLSQGTGNTTNAAQWNGAFRIDVGGTITNAGSIVGDMEVLAGGNVSNLAGGTWRGSATVTTGGRFASAGTVNGDATNAGTITNTGTWNGNLSQGTGNTTNAAQWNGVFRIDAGGTVTNTGNWTNATGFRSVVGAGLFENFGTLSGGGVTASGTTAVLANRIGGTISLANGVVLAADTGGTITNAGSIVGDVQVLAGGIVNNVAGGTWRGSATVTTGGRFASAGTVNGDATNAGTITNTGTWNGNLSQGTGNTTNAAQWNGVFRIDAGGTVTNTGNWTNATGFRSVVGAGLFENFGTLSGGGVTASGTTALLANRTGGTITLVSGVVLAADTGGTITNAGSIVGDVQVLAGGIVNNVAGGTWRGSATVTTGGRFTNAGSITGAIGNSGILASSGTIVGNLTNYTGGTATLQGSLRGSVTNGGSITLTGLTTEITALAQSASGSFDLAGFNTTLGALEGSGTILLRAGTLTVDTSTADTIFGGVIGGSGGLIKTGDRTLTLSGANGFTGPTVINGGTLVVAQGASLSGPVTNNTTFVNGGSITGPVTNNGNAVSIGTLDGGLSNGAGAVAQLANTVRGTIGNAGAITLIGDLTGGPAMTQVTSGSLDLAGFNATIGSLAGNGSVALGSGTLALGGDGSSTSFGGVISGTGALVKNGAGTLTLSGPNSFIGQTWITAGGVTLASGGVLVSQVNNTATFTNGGTVSAPVANGSTFVSTGIINGGLYNYADGTVRLAGQMNGDITNAGSVTLTGATSGIGNVTQFATGSIDLAGVSTTFGSLAGNGVIKLGSAELTVGSNAVDTRFDGAITGSGSLVKTGSGLLLLGGVNSFAGRTTVGAGSLMLASGGSLAGSVTNLATFSNAGTVSGPVTNGGRLGSTGALNGGLTNLANSSALLSGSVTGPFSNAGILLVASGTTLSAAPLANTGQVQNAGRWTGDITSSAGALFDNTATGTIVGALDNRGTLLSAGTINGRLVNSGGARLAGTIIGPILNTGEILTSGTLGVTGDVTNTGLFTVGTGTFTTSGAFNNAGALVVNADATLSLGSGTLRNSGSAALIDVAGTLRGRIDLASGGLIGRSGSLLAGDVTIASGASFMSGGTVTGTATINGTLMPGNSPGTLTINGALALGGSSTTIFEMTNGTSDRIVVNGTASIASGATLIVTGVRKATPGQTYSLLSTTGGITGSFTTIAKDSRVFGFIRQSANSIDLLGTLTLPTGANAQGTAIVNYLNDRLVAGTVTDPGLALTSSLAQLDGTPIAPLVARISPEPYASAGSMALETGLALAKTVRATPLVMRDRDRAGLFVFLQGFATGRDVAARPSGVAAANQAGEGYFGGVGYGTATLGLSAFVGRSTVRQDIAELGAQTRSRGTFFGARLHAATGGVRFNASAILDRSDSDTGRSPITGATQGRYTLRGETFDAEIAYDLPLGNGRFAIRPSAGVTHTRATRGGIAETGGGAAALTVAAQSYQATWINGEIALSASGTSKVQPWIGLGVRYMANGDPILATGTLAGFGGQFTVEGARAPRTIGHASGGVSFALARGLSAYLAGEVDVTRTGGARQIQGGIRFAF